MRHRKFFCGAAAFLASAASAGQWCTSGDYNGKWVNSGGCSSPLIVVDIGPGDPNLTGDSVTITEVSGRWNITIVFANPISGTTDHDVQVWSDDTTPQSIGTISIAVGGLSTLDDDTVLLTFENPTLPLTSGIADVGQITYSGANCAGLAVQGIILGSLGGGGFGTTLISQFGYYSNFRVNTDVLSKIVVDGEPTKTGSDFDNTFFVGRNYLADLEVVTGGIRGLEVIGSIGSFDGGGNPVPVRIGTRDAIEKVKAGQIVGTIVAGDSEIDPLYTTKRFAELEVTKLDGGTGTLHGSITASEMRYNSNDPGSFSIEGNFGGGTIQLLDTLELPAQIRIGGSLASTATISLPTNGLQGTILINAENNSGSWQSGGVITVGSATLSQATYATLPGAVGGGVAGLTDSGYFGAACSPAANSIRSVWPPAYLGDCDDPPSYSGGIAHADLRFRTAVEVDGDGFTVLRTLLGTSFNNATDVTSQYTWAILSGDASESTVRFTRTGGGDAFLTGYEYRIIPVSEKVRVKHAAGTPDVNMTYYQFGVQWSCDLGLLEHFDLNQDEALCSQDIAAWLNDPIDFDGDIVADTTNLGYLVNGVNVWQNR